MSDERRTPLSGDEAVHLLRLLALARGRGFPLLGTLEASGDLPGLPAIRRMMPRLRAAGEERFLDEVASSLEAGIDAPAGGALRLLARGGLPADGLVRLAGWIGGRVALRRRFRAAVVYPFSVALTGAIVYSLLVTGFAGALLASVFEDLFAGLGASLPVPTKLALAIWGVPARIFSSPATAVAWSGVVLAAAALVLRFGATLHDRRVAFWIPVVGRRIRLHGAADFCGGLGFLLGQKVPLADALSASAGAVSNREMRRRLSRLSAGLDEGGNLGEALRAATALPPSVRWRLWAAYYRSDLPAELERVADDARSELETSGRRLDAGASLFGWAVAVVALLPIAFFVVAMYMPMFSLLSKIG